MFLTAVCAYMLISISEYLGEKLSVVLLGDFKAHVGNNSCENLQINKKL